MTDTPARPRPPEPTERGIQVGPQLLIRFGALIRTARTHDVSNQAFVRQLHDFMELLQSVFEEEHEVVLVAVGDSFFVNGNRVKAQASLMGSYHAILVELERRTLGGVRFQEGVTVAELERFFRLFMAAEDPALAEQFEEAVQTASIEHVQPVPQSQIDADVSVKLDEKVQSERGRAKKTFWRAVSGVKKMVVRTVQTGRPDLRHAKRIVQPVVDSIMKHEYSIVGMTALKDHDEYTYAHCVNVSVLSVSMGHVLGLPRQALADLGVAALLHDVGKIAVPGEVLRKPGALDDNEWGMLRRHPLEGMKMLIRMPGLSTLAIDSIRTCFEHHMNFNGTGYPKVEGGCHQATMSRIVALADCFDAMTAHRAYHRRPYSPFEGLHYLLGRKGEFDPAIMWALVRTVGLYPPGSVLATSSKHIVLATSPNADDLRRPFCRVIALPDGTFVPEDQAPTWEPMPADERVVRVLRPDEYTVNTSDLLAA